MHKLIFGVKQRCTEFSSVETDTVMDTGGNAGGVSCPRTQQLNDSVWVGIEPLTLQLLHNLLYPLSHGCPTNLLPTACGFIWFRFEVKLQLVFGHPAWKPTRRIIKMIIRQEIKSCFITLFKTNVAPSDFTWIISVWRNGSIWFNISRFPYLLNPSPHSWWATGAVNIIGFMTQTVKITRIPLSTPPPPIPQV